MLAGRGFATAVVLTLIALACGAVARRLERERRLVAALRARGAIDAAHAIPLDALGDAERYAVEEWRSAGVGVGARVRCDVMCTALAPFKRKRVRLALTAVIAAVLLAVGLVALILAR